jgi:hypothetical protein
MAELHLSRRWLSGLDGIFSFAYDKKTGHVGTKRIKKLKKKILCPTLKVGNFHSLFPGNLKFHFNHPHSPTGCT